MGWRLRLVGACVLTVLALLPAAGTLCVALCEPAVGAGPAHHHQHHDVSRAVAGVDASGTVLSAPPHDCRTHEITLQAFVTERSSWQTTLVPLAPEAAVLLFDARAIGVRSLVPGASPPPLASSATTSLILRI